MKNFGKWLLTIGIIGSMFFEVWFFWTHWGVFGKIVMVPLTLMFVIWLASGITTVNEGTAKLVVSFGSFSHCIMAWKDHDFRRNVADNCTNDNELDVVSSPGTQSASGLRWIGPWPIFSVVTYNLRYRAVELLEGREVVETHDLRSIDYFTLKPHINWLDLLNAETAGEAGGTGALSFNLEFLLGLQIINPYKAHFGAPSNWNQNTITKFSALFRAWVATKSPVELKTFKGNSQGANGPSDSSADSILANKFCQEILQDPVVKYIERVWGIVVIENGIEIRDLNMTEKLQDAFAAEQEQKLRAKGLAAQTADPVMQYLSAMTGRGVSVLQVEYNTDPAVFNARYQRQISKAEDMAEQTIPLANGRTQNMFPGADGIGKLLLGLVSTARGGGQGGNNPPTPPSVTTPSSTPTMPSGEEPMTRAQADAFWEEMEERIKKGKE